MFSHKVKELEQLKPVSRQNNSNKYTTLIKAIRYIYICCIVVNMTKLAQDTELKGGHL